MSSASRSTPRQASAGSATYQDYAASRPRSSTGASTARPHRQSSASMRARRPSTAFTGSTGDYSEEEWETGEVEGKRKKKKDEPMSPVVVVFYVTALYVIFQILTRSDEHEILSHLPTSFHSPIGLSGPNVHSDVHPPHYNFPYHLPHLSSPLPSSSDSRPGFWRGLLGVLIYPVYLLVTLLAIPLPLLLNTIHLVLSVLSTILYPLTSTARILGKTFIVGPWSMTRSILGVFYPIYTFVGGVIGVGCVMGMSAGWVGKTVLDLIYGKSSKTKRRRSGREHGKAKERERSAIKSTPQVDVSTITQEPDVYAPTPPQQFTRSASISLGSPAYKSAQVPLSAVSPNLTATRKPIKLDKKRVLDKLAATYREIQHVENAGYVDGGRRGPDGGKTTGREAQATGTRRRAHGLANGELGRAR